METHVHPEQLNRVVRPLLQGHLQNSFQLTTQGQNRVIQANADLGEEYAHHQWLPVADWCFQEIKGKVAWLPPSQWDELLDVCAGTGYISLNLMRKGLFKNCVALDINQDALNILSQRARDLGVHGIKTEQGDIFQTHFPDNRFDCIVGNAFLHHLPDVPRFLAEMIRILKPGGVLCLTKEPGISTEFWENVIPVTLKRLVGKKHWPENSDDVPLTDIWQFKQSTIKSLFESAGFETVKVVGVGRYSSSLYELINRRFVRMTGKSAPHWALRFAYWLRKIEPGPNPETHADQFGSIFIVARKG
ncbi:MAG: class I SAM-dependent methyltransferase [Bdellovibrionales bacterium]